MVKGLEDASVTEERLVVLIPILLHSGWVVREYSLLMTNARWVLFRTQAEEGRSFLKAVMSRQKEPSPEMSELELMMDRLVRVKGSFHLSLHEIHEVHLDGRHGFYNISISYGPGRFPRQLWVGAMAPDAYLRRTMSDSVTALEAERRFMEDVREAIRENLPSSVRFRDEWEETRKRRETVKAEALSANTFFTGLGVGFVGAGVALLATMFMGGSFHPLVPAFGGVMLVLGLYVSVPTFYSRRRAEGAGRGPVDEVVKF